LAKRVESQRTIARAEARAAARAVAAKKAKRGNTTKVAIIAGSFLAGLGIVAVIALSVFSPSTLGGGSTPKGVENSTAPIVVGSAKAKTTIDLWEDFRCPACRAFEGEVGNQIVAGIESGKIRVRYHMLSFLTPTSREASRRAANASAVAYDLGGQDAFIKFHTWAYANQPDESVDGFFADQLAGLAGELGLKDSVAYSAGVRDMKFANYVDAVNGSMLSNKIQSTPTIFVNGKNVPWANVPVDQLLKNLGL